MKIRLQFGVAAVFTLLTAVLIGIVVAFLYFGNRQLALNTAHEEMIQARAWSVANMLDTIGDTELAVSSAAEFVSAFPDRAKSVNGLNVLHALARGGSHYYGLYYGMEENGAFYQNILLPEEFAEFGPEAVPVPDGATRALRIIDGPAEDRVETYFWSDDGNAATAFSRAVPTYDPRTRPWYQGAVEAGGLYATEPYVFQSTGELGVTFADPILAADGTLIGVAGVDITLSSLARILEEMRIGQDGVVFMMDASGRLVSYTGSRADGQGTRFVATEPDAEIDIGNTLVAAAMSRWNQGGEAFFQFKPTRDSDAHIVSVAPIAEIFGVEYTLGLVVPAGEFVADINRTTARAVQISGLVLLVAVASTAIFARLLSASLTQVAQEARRISNFELGDDLNLKTTLLEVSELETAMSNMKAGLASFGAYVPKDLVRAIVSRGEKTGVGGTAREVTLLFSDLQGFTARTEGLAPEELMPALSRYFEVMETEIAATSGTVDKYIGDAIMAMWNAPEDDAAHVANACRAALACRIAEDTLNTDPLLAPLAPLRTRFGLHKGDVIVGNVGSLSRMQYTALGAVVNLASRIEGLNKAYGTRILVSDSVAADVSGQFLFREVDIVSPAGTTQPTILYELIGALGTPGPLAASDAQHKDVTDWAACYALYRARAWAEALEAFQSYRRSARNTDLADTYIRRCEAFLSAPPPEDWDGVYGFTTK